MLAPITISLDDSGLKRLLRKLADIDQKAATKAVRDGINEATVLVLRAAKANAPVRTGQLKKSLGRKVTTIRASKKVVGKVGPRAGFRTVFGGKAVNPAKYAHLVEFGHKGPHAAPAHPFLYPAWTATRGKVAGIIARRINAALKAVANRG